MIFALLLIMLGFAVAVSRGPARAEPFVAALGGVWALLWLLVIWLTRSRVPAVVWRGNGAIAYRARRLAGGYRHAAVFRMPLSRILRVTGSPDTVILGLARTTSTSSRPSREFEDAILVDSLLTKRLGIEPDRLRPLATPVETRT